MMNLKYALLIIDAQVNMFYEANPIHQAELLFKTLQELIRKARLKNVPVFWIRNNGEIGEPDEPGTQGWEINPKLKPDKEDKIIDKHKISAFEGTDLKLELDQKMITHLVIIGMQTEFCINSTARHAVELGFEVILVEDGHSTYDSKEMKASEIIKKYNEDLNNILKIEKAENILF
jgi:nicotinamidase-related amidase